MLDIAWIRHHPEESHTLFERRGVAEKLTPLIEADAHHRETLTQLQECETDRNALAKTIGMKKKTGEDATPLEQEAKDLKQRIAQLEQESRTQVEGLHDLLASLPNFLDKNVPDGQDEADNIVIKQHGTPRSFAFTPRAHADLGHDLGQMDFQKAAQISGSRFVILKGALARLERALSHFMLDIQATHGFEEVSPPLIVRDEAVFGTGQLPKFSHDLFQTTLGSWLIPTSEVALTNLVREEILDENVLPLRFTALTPCFRSEAGAAGRDTHGMIRLHQFHKVEMVSIAHPSHSNAEHERMVNIAEEILQKLDLPYRISLLCAGDTGASAQKTYDLEVWLPGEGTYREISSCSNCGPYQARRMNARYRDATTRKPQFLHTLNGSGLAVGRALVAILENGQEENGDITLPSALHSYFGATKISRE